MSKYSNSRSTKGRSISGCMNSGSLSKVKMTTHVCRKCCKRISRIEIIDYINTLNIINDLNYIFNISFSLIKNSTHVCRKCSICLIRNKVINNLTTYEFSSGNSSRIIRYRLSCSCRRSSKVNRVCNLKFTD